MKFLALFFILGTAAVVKFELAAAEESLECYWCLGFNYKEAEAKYYNTRDCTLDSFRADSDNVAKITNKTNDDQKVLACVTASVWIQDWNNNEPITGRAGVAYRDRQPPASLDLFDLFELDLFSEEVEDAARAHPEHNVYFGIELCYQNLCNTHTYHRGAAASVLPGVSLVLLAAGVVGYLL